MILDNEEYHEDKKEGHVIRLYQRTPLVWLRKVLSKGLTIV